MAVGLAVVGVGGEDAVGVEAVGAVRVLVVDRPRDTRGSAELVVGQAGVVDRPTGVTSPHASNASSEVRQPISGSPSMSVNPIASAYVRKMSRSLRASSGGSTACSERWTMRLTLVKHPDLLPPPRCGEYDVGELGGLGQEQVLHHDEALLAGQDPADPGGLRHRDGRVGGRDPQESDRAGLGVGHDLHRVCGRCPVRHRHRIDLPQVGQLLDVSRVVPVAETRQVTVGAAFAVVLGRRLPVHLQHAGAGTADQAAQQVQVVHRHRRSGGLVRLVEALQHGREHGLALAEDPGGLRRSAAGTPQMVRPPRACTARPSPAGRRRRSRAPDPLRVHPAVDEQLAGQSVHQREVRADPWCEVDPARALCLGRDEVWRGSTHTMRGGSSPRVRSRIRAHRTVWVSGMLCPNRKIASQCSMSV